MLRFSDGTVYERAYGPSTLDQDARQIDACADQRRGDGADAGKHIGEEMSGCSGRHLALRVRDFRRGVKRVVARASATLM